MLPSVLLLLSLLLQQVVMGEHCDMSFGITCCSLEQGYRAGKVYLGCDV